MGKDGKVDSVNRNTEEKSEKKSKKDKKLKKSAIGMEEVHNADLMKTVESARMSEKEGVSEVKRDHKRDKEEKRKKKEDKDKGVKDAEVELTAVLGDNGGGREMDNAAMERKKREKNKNKSDKFEMHGTEEVKRGESIHLPVGGSVSGKESGKEVVEEKKKKRNNIKEGEKDGEVTQALSENCMVKDTEIRKKRKKDEKKSKGKEVVEEKKKKQIVKRNNIKEGEKDGEVTRTVSENCTVNATEIRKKRKKDEKKSKDDNVPENVEDHAQATEKDGNAKTNNERKKKKHKKKQNFKDDLSAANDTNSLLNASEAQKSEAEHTKKRKKEKTKISENEAEYANKGKKRKTCLADGTSPNKSNKKVRFSGQDEVFPVPNNSNTEKGEVEEKNMVRGKRFTLEEDEIVKAAVMKYIEDNELGDEGVDLILNCQKHPEVKGCWKKIASSIPYRPYEAIYFRARILFMRSEKREWTQEEKDMVKKYQKEHGNKWRALADELGKHTWHVKDTWRRIKLENRKRGQWSQDEYQKLFDLVNTDLQLKVSEEKRSKHGMLRDNIGWTAISDVLSTRNCADCCIKWYDRLRSNMAAKGIWADTDDYRLISELYNLDATCIEDVDWDNIIETRAGDVCRRRWNQMVRYIGDNGKKSFAEQVDVLAKRYCPHLLEAREIWDNKPRVP